MKMLILAALTVPVISFSSQLFSAADPIPNRLIDYAGFQKIVDTSGPEREKMRLTEEQFLAAMSDPNAVVLDARSANMYQLRHIKGAVSLPFTDFTATSLSGILPSKDVKILIYCNNNFLGSPVAFASKMPPASLNLATYTSLKAYGYDNIYELGPLLDVKATKIPFEGTEVK
jgi:phage shock protein E